MLKDRIKFGMKLLVPLMLILVSITVFNLPSVHATTAYYIDCTNGNDSKNGRSETDAWKTLAKANNTVFSPGDLVLLKRGCAFSDQLQAKWNGTSTNPITVSAYGTGSDPKISFDAKNSVASRVNINATGSYITIDHIQSAIVNPVTDSSCTAGSGGVPYGWYVGYTISGSNITVKNSDISGGSLGVNLTDGSSNNRILNNEIHDLNALWRIGGNAGSMGAMGVNFHGTNNEAGYNIFRRNYASCTLASDGSNQVYSTPFELYNANKAYIHHNAAYEHRKHLEMGKDTDTSSADNVIAYNLFVSSRDTAVGPNIHGSGNPFGPIDRTTILNNTVVLTGNNSQGIVCSCSGGAIVKNNIFAAEFKAGYYGGGNYTESNNIYWDYKTKSDASQDPFVQFTGTPMNSSSIIADPTFVSASVPGGNFHLQPSSPAIDKGSTTGVSLGYTKDIDLQTVPYGNGVDIGSDEYFVGGVTPTTPVTTTPQPTATHSPTITPTPTSRITITPTNAMTPTVTQAPTSTSVPSPTEPRTCESKRRGDANCDGKINLNDFERLRKELTGELESLSADFNKDGKVNLTDFELWRTNFL